MKGLHVSVHGTDCTNGGVTSGRKTVTLIGPGIPELFEASEEYPAVIIVVDFDPDKIQAGQLTVAKPKWLAEVGIDKRPTDDFTAFRDQAGWTQRHQIVNVVARPVDAEGNPVNGGMSGGHYVSCCDSRYPFTSPIPVHDRFER